MHSRKLLLCICIGLCAATFSAAAQYSIKSEFGNLTDCDTMTRGIFIVWWQNDRDLSADASTLLDSMIALRDVCLDVYHMTDPPNPGKGYYYNVYLYRNGDLFPDGWGNGQGTDTYHNPYLTLPLGAHKDWGNVAHETFHIFQYGANSPGFGYNGDSQWYIEATANWFASIRHRGAARNFVEAESLVRLPNVSLWLSYNNFPASYPQNWQRYVHQYASALFLYYLTEEAGVPGLMLVEGFFSGTDELPQEYLYNRIGGAQFRQHFIDWAGHMTNRFDFLPENQVKALENEWKDYADSTDDNEFIRTYVDSGSGGLFRPEASQVTTGWSFNTYRVFNNSADKYTFRIVADPTGSKGTPSYFQGQVVVMNRNTGAAFHNLTATDNLFQELSIDVTPDDTALYFIIASMPEYFRDVEQTFGYRMSIIKGPLPTSGIEDPAAAEPVRVEVARYNLLGQKIGSDYRGLQIIRYNDGAYEKRVGPVD